MSTHLTSWTGTVPGSSPNHDWLWLDPINTASRLADIWTSQAKEAGNFPPYDLNRNEDSTQWKLTIDRKSTRLNSSHIPLSRMPSSA